jgi:N-acyl-D-amino-acid deacylase
VFDLLIVNGELIDGSAAPPRRADVAIRGDRIADIGELANSPSRETIDARGQIVAPGFLDVHNHSDGWLLKQPAFRPKLLQGITSEVLMADGVSYAPVRQDTWAAWLFYLRGLNGLLLEDYDGWETLAEYMQRLEGRTAQNAAAHVPYANVRSAVCGFSSRHVDDYQMRQIRHEIRQCLEAGAVGLSTGLDYIVQLHADTEEIVGACRELAAYSAIYATHVRYKSGLLVAVEEALEIGRRAGVGVHVSHLKAPSVAVAEQVLQRIDAAARDVEVTFDVYPYQPGSTLLSYLLPYEVWSAGPLAALDRLQDPVIHRRFAEGLQAYGVQLDQFRIAWLPGHDNRHWLGKTLREYVRGIGIPAEDALLRLLIEERLAVLCVVDEQSETQVDPFITHSRGMVASDGIFFPEGIVHPRVYGTVGKFFRHYVRETGQLSWEQAVHKLSGFPASRFGLAERGILRAGNFADVVVFDPMTIADQATYEDPHRPTTGVREVVINGVRVVEDGRLREDLPRPLPGRFLRRERL